MNYVVETIIRPDPEEASVLDSEVSENEEIKENETPPVKMLKTEEEPEKAPTINERDPLYFCAIKEEETPEDHSNADFDLPQQAQDLPVDSKTFMDNVKTGGRFSRYTVNSQPKVLTRYSY